MRTSFLIFISLVFVMGSLNGCGDDPAAPKSDPVNHAPGQPAINTAAGGPAHGATNCPISQALYWQCSDPDGDALKFDVYFGQASPPVEVSTAQAAMSHNPGTLAYSTTYYWMVVAEDPDSATTSSAEWSFTTMAEPTESVTDPNTPTGPAAGEAGVNLDYLTGGSVSDMAHPVEYRFDWDDGSMSTWSASTTESHSWAAAGTYNVKAQARCATDTAVESAWSSGIDVVITVTTETVTTPGDVTGPADGTTIESLAYQVTVSTSSLGHTVEYQFDWDDGSFSSWSASNGANHVWAAAGSYEVKAQARCRDHTSIVSSWTAALTVVITVPAESVTRPTVTVFPEFLELGVEGVFVARYARHNLGHPVEYQFDYGDGTTSPWIAATRDYGRGEHTYAAAGDFEVKARGRCADHTTFESEWSHTVTVTVFSGAEVVTTPSVVAPSDLEDRTTLVGRELRFLLDGAASSHGHDLQYRYDLGDGTVTDWALSYEYRHSYSAWGDYQVKAQARCRDHTTIETPWSDEITIHIIESIAKPDITGPDRGVVEVPVTFTTTGSTSSEGHELEYQFYVSFSSINPDLGYGGQGWSSSMELEFTFPAGEGGRYYVSVRARL